MTGAVARSEQLDAIADNLANASTPGFTQSRPSFEAFLPADGDGNKTYTAAVESGTDLSPGPTILTGNPMDVAPEHGAFLSVLLPDGTTAFTRDGRIQIDSEGRLMMAGGGLALDRQGQPITVPPELAHVTAVDRHGVVTSNGEPQATLGLFQLGGPLNRLGAGLLSPGANGTALQVDTGVQTGAVIQSNARPLDAAVAMVSAQRHYDTAMQAISTYRRLDERANEVGRIR